MTRRRPSDMFAVALMMCAAMGWFTGHAVGQTSGGPGNGAARNGAVIDPRAATELEDDRYIEPYPEYRRKPGPRHDLSRTMIPQLRDEGEYRELSFRTGRAYEGLLRQWRASPLYLPGVDQPVDVYLRRWSDGDAYFEGPEGRRRDLSPYHNASSYVNPAQFAERLWDGARFVPEEGWDFEEYRNVEAVREAYAAARVGSGDGDTITGTVLGMERMAGSYASPVAMRLVVRDEQGRMRTVELGEAAMARRFLPEVAVGQSVAMRGRMIDVLGQPMFHAVDVSPAGEALSVPAVVGGQTMETVRGRVTGIREVATRQGQLQAVIATVQRGEGGQVEVLMGSPVELRRADNALIQPGDRVRLTGRERVVDGQESFLARGVETLEAEPSVFGGYFGDEPMEQEEPRQPPELRE